MKITAREFNDCWNACLGDNWCVEEGDYAVDDTEPNFDPLALIDVSSTCLCWQGDDDPVKGPGLSNALIDGVKNGEWVAFTSVLHNWRGTQNEVTIVAVFTMATADQEAVAALRAQLVALGGVIQ